MEVEVAATGESAAGSESGSDERKRREKATWESAAVSKSGSDERK